MASVMDAVFMPVAALFVIFFLIPGILLAPQNSADFASAVSVPNSRMAVQAMMMTYFMDEGGDDTKNYKAISYKLSGSPGGHNIRKWAIYTYPSILSHFKIDYNSPYSGEDFNDEMLDNKKQERVDLYYNIKIPVRGGEIGSVKVNWQVY
jgi:hypothetical protein